MLRRSVALLALLCACCQGGRCGGDGAGPADAGAVAIAPVPAPEGLVMVARVAAPGATLTALRELGGDAAYVVPRTVGGLAVQWFGLPLQAAEHFDEDVPLVLAAASVEGKLAIAAAFHVRQSSRIVAVAAHGQDNPFVAEQDDASGVLLLKPTGKSLRGAAVDAALGLLDNHLVVGDSVEALRRLGPYLTRTLAREPANGLEVRLEKGAAAGPLGAALGAAGERLAALELPAFLRALLDVDEATAAARALAAVVDEGTLRVTIDAEGIAIDGDLALAGGDFAALETLAPGEILALPDDTLGAIAWSESEARRVAGAGARAAAIGELLGAPWGEGDTRALAALFEDLGRARGARNLLGLRCTGIGLTGMASGDVVDGERLGRALDALFALREHAAIVAKLEAAAISLDARRMKILEVPDELLRLRMKPTAKEGADEIDLLLRVTPRRYHAAAGLETVPTMQHFHAPEAEPALAARAPMAAAVARLPERAWLAAAVDAGAALACRAGKPGEGEAAPLALAIGPGDQPSRALLRVLIARALVPLAAKHLL
jgi:hypothetical protein